MGETGRDPIYPDFLISILSLLRFFVISAPTFSVTIVHYELAEPTLHDDLFGHSALFLLRSLDSEDDACGRCRTRLLPV